MVRAEPGVRVVLLLHRRGLEQSPGGTAATSWQTGTRAVAHAPVASAEGCERGTHVFIRLGIRIPMHRPLPVPDSNRRDDDHDDGRQHEEPDRDPGTGETSFDRNGGRVGLPAMREPNTSASGRRVNAGGFPRVPHIPEPWRVGAATHEPRARTRRQRHQL